MVKIISMNFNNLILINKIKKKIVLGIYKF